MPLLEVHERLDDSIKTSLSAREVAVLELVCRGLTNDELGQRLGITEATAKAHVSSLLRKFAVANRAELAAEAIALGIVKLGSSD